MCTTGRRRHKPPVVPPLRIGAGPSEAKAVDRDDQNDCSRADGYLSPLPQRRRGSATEAQKSARDASLPSSAREDVLSPGSSAAPLRRKICVVAVHLPRIIRPATLSELGLMTRFANILEAVGNTPVVKINRLAPDGVDLYVKVEAFNPLGSVKDRLALGVIEDAERRGTLKPGQTVSRRRAAIPASGSRWCARRRAIRSSSRWPRASASSAGGSCASSARR